MSGEIDRPPYNSTTVKETRIPRAVEKPDGLGEGRHGITQNSVAAQTDQPDLFELLLSINV